VSCRDDFVKSVKFVNLFDCPSPSPSPNSRPRLRMRVSGRRRSPLAAEAAVARGGMLMTAWTGVARTERGRCRTLGEKGGPLRGKWRSLRIGCRAEAPGQRTVLASRIVSDLRCALMTTLILRQRDSLAVAVPRRVTLATCIAGGGGTVPDIISGIINAWEYGE
jgi:hypothetical protein